MRGQGVGGVGKGIINTRNVGKQPHGNLLYKAISPPQKKKKSPSMDTYSQIIVRGVLKGPQII